MKIRKISKCYENESTQFIVLGNCGQIIAVFFIDNSDNWVYRIHYLTNSPEQQKEIIDYVTNQIKQSTHC